MVSTIFFDLDATLYSYSEGHGAGLKATYQYWSGITEDTYEEFYEKYLTSRQNIKRFLKGSVANHSRALYFQNMVETHFNKPIPYHIAELTQRYWDSFIHVIEPFEGVKETLQFLKDKNYKLAIITNMSAEIQVRKLHKLGIDLFFDALITSEEAGQQKPHPHIYLHALNRFSEPIDPENCFMVGDNYQHDIEAAEFLGMRGILVTMDLKDIPNNDCLKADKFSQIKDIIEKADKEPLDGVIKYKLSHQNKVVKLPDNISQNIINLRDKLWELNLIGVYPEDYYMTPGVGFGNASLKYSIDGQFIVSGSQTGEKEKTTISDYAIVLDYNIDENHLISKGPIKPSSESLSHAAIYEIAPEVNCVIHVHHKEMWDNYENLNMLTTPKDVPYGTPEMARALQKVYKESPKLKAPICMRGHIEGLLTWGETEEEALQLYINTLENLKKIK